MNFTLTYDANGTLIPLITFEVRSKQTALEIIQERYPITLESEGLITKFTSDVGAYYLLPCHSNNAWEKVSSLSGKIDTMETAWEAKK